GPLGWQMGGHWLDQHVRCSRVLGLLSQPQPELLCRLWSTGFLCPQLGSSTNPRPPRPARPAERAYPEDWFSIERSRSPGSARSAKGGDENQEIYSIEPSNWCLRVPACPLLTPRDTSPISDAPIEGIKAIRVILPNYPLWRIDASSLGRRS